MARKIAVQCGYSANGSYMLYAAGIIDAGNADLVETVKTAMADGKLQTYEDRERFRKAARATLHKYRIGHV